MPLYLAAIKKEENYLGGITWKPFIWGSLSRGNFMVDSCLGVSICGKLFYGAIIWAPIVQGLIIRGEITVKTLFFGGGGVGGIGRGAIILRGNCPETNYPGSNNSGWGNCPVLIYFHCPYPSFSIRIFLACPIFFAAFTKRIVDYRPIESQLIG